MAEQAVCQSDLGWWRYCRCLVWRWLRPYLVLVWRFLPYLYLLRVTLLTCLLLVSLPWLAFYGAPSVLSNLFDLNASRIFCVTTGAILTAWSLMISAYVTLINGYERFNVPLYLRRSDLAMSSYEDVGARLRESDARWPLVVAGTFMAAPVIATAMFHSSSPSLPTVLAVVLGVLAAIVLLLLGLWIFCAFVGPVTCVTLPKMLRLWPPVVGNPARISQRPLQYLFGVLIYLLSQPVYLLAWLLQVFRPLLRIVRPLLSRFQLKLNHMPRSVGKGYLDYSNESCVSIYPGHLLATAMLIVSFVFYIGLGILKFWYLRVPIVVPTLAYALALMIMLSWIFAGMTFFVDRYRVPALALLLIGAIGITRYSGSDYYYELVPDLPGTAAPPTAVINARDQSSVILVAANGGGIQSAAWTARVLTGLEAQARKEFGPDFHDFGKSIRLISSVSGGSVGAMYVLNAYSPEGLPADEELERVVEQAETSSLDNLAWGIAYPDTLRTFLPFNIVPVDRGQALEAAWDQDKSLSVPLSTWREDVRAGWRPAAVFNATIVETGERLLFSTSALDHKPFRGRRFERMFPRHDVSVVTAARLSATFPYVTPAAQARVDGSDLPQVHVVDGGYYDNYGMVTLSEWLDQALNGSRGAIKKVLVIQIRGAPDASDPIYRFEGDQPCPTAFESRLAERTTGGLGYQMFAPFMTFLNVRTTSQVAHNDVEFKLLQEVWQQRGVQIDSVTFQYPGPDTPLSWHLTPEQKRDIERYWTAEVVGCPEPKNWNKVKQFLQRMKQPVAASNYRNVRIN